MRSRKRNKAIPVVAVNFAMTWDGKVSTRNLTPADFSSPRDKRRLLEIRATGDALLVGMNTVRLDNMSMGLPDESLRKERVRRKQSAWPLRVIISNSGRIDPKLKLFQRDFSPVIIYSTTRMPGRIQKALSGKATLHLHHGDKVDLKGMLRHMRSFHKIKRLVCEGGPSLFRSLLQDGFVDEINLTLCPLIFGGRAAPTLTGLPGGFLPRDVACKLVKTEIVGEECFLQYQIAHRAGI